MKIKKLLALLIVFLLFLSLFRVSASFAVDSQDINLVATDISPLITDSIDYLTSWAEDLEYVYVGAIKKNYAAYIYVISKNSKSVVGHYSKRINYIDRFVIGYKWGRIYAAAECKVDDNKIDTPVCWYIYEVTAPNNWNQIFETEHREGGFTDYLISTNHFLYIVGYYSSCCAWGTKIVRIDKNNNCKIWRSPTGAEFYNNEHGFTTGDKIIFCHQAPFNEPILFEEHREYYNDWLSGYTKTNYISSVNRSDIFGINNKIFFLADVESNGEFDMHFVNYPATSDKVVYHSQKVVSFFEPILTPTGEIIEFFIDNASKYYYYLELSPNMSYKLIKTPYCYASGDAMYWKFMHATDNNPGAVVTTSGKKFLIYSRYSPFSSLLPSNSYSDTDIDGDGKKDLQANTGNSYVKVQTANKDDVITEAGTPTNRNIIKKLSVDKSLGSVSLYSTSSPIVLENSANYLLYEVVKTYNDTNKSSKSLKVTWDTIIPKHKDYWLIMAQIENTGTSDINLSSVSNLLLLSTNNPKKLLIPDVLNNKDISSIPNNTSFIPTLDNSIIVEYNDQTVAALGYIPPWSSPIEAFTISNSNIYSKTLFNKIAPGEKRYWQGILIANDTSSILQRHIPYSTLISKSISYKKESSYGFLQLSTHSTSQNALPQNSNLVTIYIRNKSPNTTLSVTYTSATYATLVSQSITDIMNDAKKNFIDILGSLAPKLTPFTDIGKTFMSGATVVLERFGIVKGYPSKEVKLQNNITRAEYVTEIDKMMHFELVSPSNPSFKDTPPGKWYYPYVETAVFHGIVNGYPDDTFRPENLITKAESVTVISNLLSIFYTPPTPSFKDVPKSFWGYKYIEGALLKSIIEKKPPVVLSNSYFKPNIPAIRGITNFFIYRVLIFKDLNG